MKKLIEAVKVVLRAWVIVAVASAFVGRCVPAWHGENEYRHIHIFEQVSK